MLGVVYADCRKQTHNAGGRYAACVILMGVVAPLQNLLRSP